MLLLVTIALVLASSVLLIVGFIQDTLTLIYLAIGCAAAAAVALVIFSRLTRRRALRLATSGVAAVAPVGSSPSAAPEEQVAATASKGGGDEGTADPAGADLSSPPPVAAKAPPEPVDPALGGDVEWDDEGDEVVFPIAEYDDLRVNEIVPLLGQLDDDELREVRDRETAGKGRITVLKRIDDLLSGGTAGSSGARGGAAGAEPDSGAPLERCGDATPVEGV